MSDDKQQIKKLQERNEFLEKELVKEKKTNEKVEKEINKALKKGTHKTTTRF